MATREAHSAHREQVVLSLPGAIVDDLNRIAASRGTDVEYVIKRYIAEGIAEDCLAVKRIRFTDRANAKLGKGNKQKTFEEIFPNLLY